jgi:hypothetical protein
MPRQNKHPIDGKHPIELTTDEVLERLFSRAVRDKLKQIAGEASTCGKKPPHR